MGHLFRRLTAMFWFLFLGVVSAFGINFYSRYEEIYQNKMSEYEVLQEVVISKLNNDLELFELIVNSGVNLFNSTYTSNYSDISLLPIESLKLFLTYPGLENVEDSHLAKILSIKKTYIELNEALKMMSNFHGDTLPELELSFLPFKTYIHDNGTFLSENDFENIDELMTDYSDSIQSEDFIWKLARISEENNQYYSTLFKAVEIEGQKIGFIALDIGSGEGDYKSLVLEDNTIYRFYDMLSATGKYISDDVTLLLEDGSLEEDIDFLIEKGYYVGVSKTNNELVNLVYFINKDKLHREVLSETIRLFELNLIILIILFLSVCYILFISIIKPCYLLVDYVKQCGRGNYEIPSPLNSEWRLPFMTIRNAYLDNERLLAVKENQSQELEFAWKKAMVANQAKTHFLAKVSHELRTPLNAIKGYVQLLKITVDDEKHLKKINIIERSSDLLINIVTELLDFSRIEEGKIKLNVHELNLIQVADLLEDMFINDTKAKSLNYSVTVDHLIPVVLYGDENRIKQIIINLVSNAIKFTEEGTISVLFKLDNIDAEYAYVEIRVTDTGKGISANKLNSIFDSFTQENNSISRKYGGTGLGLSISKGLAEVMGGNLSVESQVDVGSTFTLFLPLALNLIEEDEI